MNKSVYITVFLVAKKHYNQAFWTKISNHNSIFDFPKL